ncbi:MAG: hypothetical protein ABL879_16580 [Devosia sp.]
MRRLALLLVLSLIASPAAAQSVPDQAERAYKIFAGGLSQSDFLLGGQGRTAMDGTVGKWARLNGPDGRTGVESYGADRDRICAGAPISIKLVSPAVAEFGNNTPLGSFTQVYSYVAGATFAEHTDLVPYLAAIGLGPEKTGRSFDQARVTAMSIVNGIVQIYRPSPDILVITRDKGYPTILARCPG